MESKDRRNRNGFSPKKFLVDLLPNLVAALIFSLVVIYVQGNSNNSEHVFFVYLIGSVVVFLLLGLVFNYFVNKRVSKFQSKITAEKKKLFNDIKNDKIRFENEMNHKLESYKASVIELDDTISVSLNYEFSRLYSEVKIILNDIDDKSHYLIDDLLIGWLHQVAEEIKYGGTALFEIDSDYYEGCLLRLKSQEIKAVADLSSKTENFWVNNPDPNEVKVSVRVFLMDWQDLFDDNILIKYINTFRQHSEHYPVRFGITPSRTSWNENSKIKEFSNSTDWHLLLGEPNIIGGYVQEDDRLLLRIMREDYSFAKALKVYTNLENDSIQYVPEWRLPDLRRAINAKHHVGYWQDYWKDEVEYRGPLYFPLYDRHILTWIAKYPELIEGATSMIIDNIIRIYRSHSSQITILEIGFGTGSLTEKVLDWCYNFGKDIPSLINRVHYVGIDRASEQMMPFLEQKVNINLRDREFHNGTAFKSLPRTVDEHESFEVIFASLVLHDILGLDHVNKFEELLKDLNYYLSPGGVAIFADIFLTGDEKKDRSRLEYWKYHMNSHLYSTTVERFLSHNKDMVSPILESVAISLGDKHGFKVDFSDHPEYQRNTPFRLMEIKKKTK